MVSENPRMSRAVFLLPVLAACTDSSIELGKGSAPDARFAADLYTWPCSTSSTTTDSGGTTGTSDVWEGVFQYGVSLEYAPDALVDRGLPTTGCVSGLDVFARDAGSGGLDIPGAPSPTWSNGDATGTLERQTPGFYYANVLDNERSCQESQELLGEGTLLSDAGSFSGARTPQPGTFESVTLTGDVNSNSGLEFGATVTADWDASGWTSSWVQVRRENDGALVESVTCNTTGSTSFDVDDAVWSLMTSAIRTDVTNLYVAVENAGVSRTEDGQEIELITRAMHVAVVQD
jgi:hypothetical protein